MHDNQLLCKRRLILIFALKQQIIFEFCETNFVNTQNEPLLLPLRS